MSDSFGDGWNGATATITDAANGTIVATGAVPDDFTFPFTSTSSSLSLCLPDGCYILTVGTGGFPAEIGWILTGINGGLQSGGSGANITFSVGDGNCTIGCTEPFACNYDPEAGLSDCSLCVYDTCSGCTYANAENYNPDAVIDDGSCIIVASSSCPWDFDENGIIGVSDLIEFISHYGELCD
jgi:hypothetical protein